MKLAPLALLLAGSAAAGPRVWIKPSGAPAPVAQVQALAHARVQALISMSPLDAARALAETPLTPSRADRQAAEAVRTLVLLPELLNQPKVRKAAERTLGDANIAGAAYVSGKMTAAAAADPEVLKKVSLAQDRIVFRAMALAEELQDGGRKAAPPASEPGAVWTTRRLFNSEKGPLQVSRMKDRELVKAARAQEMEFRVAKLELADTRFASAARRLRYPGDLWPVYDAVMEEISKRPKAIMLYEGKETTGTVQ